MRMQGPGSSSTAMGGESSSIAMGAGASKNVADLKVIIETPTIVVGSGTSGVSEPPHKQLEPGTSAPDFVKGL